MQKCYKKNTAALQGLTYNLWKPEKDNSGQATTTKERKRNIIRYVYMYHYQKESQINVVRSRKPVERLTLTVWS